MQASKTECCEGTLFVTPTILNSAKFRICDHNLEIEFVIYNKLLRKVGICKF